MHREAGVQLVCCLGRRFGSFSVSNGYFQRHGRWNMTAGGAKAGFTGGGGNLPPTVNVGNHSAVKVLSTVFIIPTMSDLKSKHCVFVVDAWVILPLSKLLITVGLN